MERQTVLIVDDSELNRMMLMESSITILRLKMGGRRSG